jgi:hypothetical protein
VPASATPRPRVPATIQAAAIVTWVCCGLTVLMTFFFLLAAAFIGGIVLDYFEMSDRMDIVQAVIGTAALVVALCGVASWLALCMWRRHSWARIALAVISGLALVGSVLTLGPHTALVAPGTVAVLVLLFLPTSNVWFEADPAGSL